MGCNPDAPYIRPSHCMYLHFEAPTLSCHLLPRAMSQGENIYKNVIPIRDEGSGSGKRHGFLLVISISVLFLSLMANGLLTYLYCRLKWAPVSLPEQIRNCSTTETGAQHMRFNDRIYIFPSDKMNWISSRKSCQELGGDLVIINSKEEHELLAGLVGNIGSSSLYWIGLTDAENEDVWLWVDGTPLNKNLLWWNDTPDDYKQHDPLGEDCVVYSGGKWADVSCLTLQKRICEIY